LRTCKQNHKLEQILSLVNSICSFDIDWPTLQYLIPESIAFSLPKSYHILFIHHLDEYKSLVPSLVVSQARSTGSTKKDSPLKSISSISSFSSKAFPSFHSPIRTALIHLNDLFCVNVRFLLRNPDKNETKFISRQITWWAAGPDMSIFSIFHWKRTRKIHSFRVFKDEGLVGDRLWSSNTRKGTTQSAECNSLTWNGSMKNTFFTTFYYELVF